MYGSTPLEPEDSTESSDSHVPFTRIVRSSGDTAIELPPTWLTWDQVSPSSADAYTPSSATANTRIEGPATMSKNPAAAGIGIRSQDSPPSVDRAMPSKPGRSN